MGYTERGIGYQRSDTILAAAEDSTGKKVTLRQQVYTLLTKSPTPLSTEEIAQHLARPYFSVQPRLSELSNDRRVRDSGKRGKTQWGKACILLEVPHGEAKH